jgi:cell division protein FtsI (penicillin-binding protein 3)
MKPYLVNSISENGEDIQTFKPHILVDKICDDETLGKLKGCLLAVVQSPHGTAHALESNVYEFAGKTGTAVTAMDNRGYNKSAKIYQSAFMGYFPANNPQYSIGIVIQNSSESKNVYGASVSAPVFKEVADKLYAIRVANKSFVPGNVPQDEELYKFYGMKKDVSNIFDMFKYKKTDSVSEGLWRTTILQDGNAKLISDNISTSAKIVPDVSGMGLKDAVYLLENMGLKVSASGRGKVIYQSIAQNTTFNKGETIKIQLN